jgi:uncharacterized protein (TIGR02147 family)
LKTILAFEDYRAYIEAYYLEKKKSDSRYSIRQLSSQAGFDADTYIWQVIRGRRNLTTDQIFSVAHALELSEPETRYFECLVLFNQSKSEQGRLVYQHRLKAMLQERDLRVEKIVSKKPARLLFREALMPAYLLCIGGKTIEQALLDLEMFFSIKSDQGEVIISDFEKNGFIAKKGHELLVDWNCVLAKANALEIGGKNFLREHLRVAAYAIEKQFATGGIFYSTTLSLPREKLVEAKAKVAAFLENLSSECEWTQANEFFQVNIQLYGLDQRTVSQFRKHI